MDLIKYEPISGKRMQPTYISSYSANEQKLFVALGFGDDWPFVKPFEMYRSAAVEQFINPTPGPARDALRRACGWLFDPKQNRCRLNPEFEQLIQFKE